MKVIAVAMRRLSLEGFVVSGKVFRRITNCSKCRAIFEWHISLGLRSKRKPGKNTFSRATCFLNWRNGLINGSTASIQMRKHFRFPYLSRLSLSHRFQIEPCDANGIIRLERTNADPNVYFCRPKCLVIRVDDNDTGPIIPKGVTKFCVYAQAITSPFRLDLRVQMAGLGFGEVMVNTNVRSIDTKNSGNPASLNTGSLMDFQISFPELQFMSC